MTCVKQLTRGQTGNLLGKLFEGMIRSEIKKNWRGIPYRYAHGRRDKSASLLVTGFEMITVEGSSLASNIKENKAKKRVIYCPNADSFDFVIFDSDSKSHGLQVSVQTRINKCRSNFFENKDCDYKYILTPETIDLRTLRTNKCLKLAYEKHNLRIVVAEDMVPEDVLPLLQ